MFFAAHLPATTPPQSSLSTQQKQAWQKLLLFAPQLFGSAKGVVDSPGFYLSPTGRIDSDSELAASAMALHQDPEFSCRFPARALWLQVHVNQLAAAAALDSIVARCERVKNWLARYYADAIDLVYTDHFLGNPASVFGHTFIRLRGQESEAAKAAGVGLFDPAIAFVAFPDTKNPLLYAAKGLFGGFPGRLSVMPMYMKIQEYNNHESRDMWSYRLRLNAEQRSWLLLLLFELSDHTIDYYYFDDNCSYVLLILLQAVRPDLSLVEQAKPWIIPSDVVQMVQGAEDFVEGIYFEPSIRSQYLARLRKLTESERQEAVRLFASQDFTDSAQWRSFSAVQQASMIDTVIDFVDYKERIAGSKMPDRYATLRKQLLFARAKLPTLAAPGFEVEQEQQPDRAPKSSFLSLGLGASQQYAQPKQASRIKLMWRPALRDQFTPGSQVEGMAIEFMKTTVAYRTDTKRITLSDLTLLHLSSPATDNDFESKLGWKLRLRHYEPEVTAFPIKEPADTLSLAILLGREFYSAMAIEGGFLKTFESPRALGEAALIIGWEKTWGGSFKHDAFCKRAFGGIQSQSPYWASSCELVVAYRYDRLGEVRTTGRWGEQRQEWEGSIGVYF